MGRQPRPRQVDFSEPYIREGHRFRHRCWWRRSGIHVRRVHEPEPGRRERGQWLVYQLRHESPVHQTHHGPRFNEECSWKHHGTDRYRLLTRSIRTARRQRPICTTRSARMSTFSAIGPERIGIHQATPGIGEATPRRSINVDWNFSSKSIPFCSWVTITTEFILPYWNAISYRDVRFTYPDGAHALKFALHSVEARDAETREGSVNSERDGRLCRRSLRHRRSLAAIRECARSGVPIRPFNTVTTRRRNSTFLPWLARRGSLWRISASVTATVSRREKTFGRSGNG